MIEQLGLNVPQPYEAHAVADKQVHVKRDGWIIHPSPRWPGEGIVDHLIFALKYEGVNLLVLKRAFQKTGETLLAQALTVKPGSSYLRRLAFLYEFLLNEKLPIPDSATGNYVPVLDERLQYGAGNSDHMRDLIRSKRFRIIANLPGTTRFCPLVARTQRLDAFLASNLPEKARELVSAAPQDILARAAAYLLLADSKASFEIEKERPSKARLARWGAAIGRAGRFDLSIENLIELQREVIGDARFIHIGLRTEGGFVGDRGSFNEPLPEHVSAKAEDLIDLLQGLIDYEGWSDFAEYDGVLAAAALAFGFVYIHPFEDGNGRIHRFLIHHVLAHRRYTPNGLIFPISNAILHDLLTYRTTLETWSKPLLSVIDWHPTERGNVEVRNDTADFYRFFDATPHAEFLFQCLARTIEDDLPRELRFLEMRDRFHRQATQVVDMPERTIDLLLSFLRQGNGRLSRRAIEKEFAALTTDEIGQFEDLYAELTTSG
ncbi:cell division protein Fic [Aureimonas endophytica]|uniref:Cell division protein Fic n=1 Tax=Aureimonas endophytica TaxID=2027858 RepID=A0A917E6A3_9HYPH|nr:Fic family protein [Aureimonas endophytica]GGE08621.1 cell division protein Fic [Aureimonas endophytica]